MARESAMTKTTIRTVALLQSRLVEPGTSVDMKDIIPPKSGQRSDAARFFFEMLVLGSRGAVSLSQEKMYGDISITANASLFSSP